MQTKAAKYMEFLAPRGAYALCGIASLLGLWSEGMHVGSFVLFGGIFLLCTAQFVRPTPLGWAMFVVLSCLGTVFAGVMLLAGFRSPRSLLFASSCTVLTALLCLARPARPAQNNMAPQEPEPRIPSQRNSDTTSRLQTAVWATVGVIFLLGLGFIARLLGLGVTGLGEQRTARDQTEDHWARAERIIERPGAHARISEVIDEMGSPDSVQSNVSYHDFGKTGIGSCYWWGRHGVLVSAYDEVIGTCRWVPKR